MFEVQQLDISHDQRTILRKVSLRSEYPGMLFVVGPGGSGKSSLLNALRSNGRPSSMTTSGDIMLDGVDIQVRAPDTVHVPQHCAVNDDAPLGTQLADMLATNREAMVRWTAGLAIGTPATLLDRPAGEVPASLRRALGVLATLERKADLYLLDEPTAGIEGASLNAIRRRIETLSRRAVVVMATHNRRDCLALGGHTALLAGGRVQEFAPSTVLFNQPVSPAARTYVATGNCCVRSAPPSAQADGLWWLERGLLCGMSRPGMMGQRQTQFELLAAEGVSQLVCLEEKCLYDTSPLRPLGIAHYHFPVADMGVPSFSQAVDICRLSETQINANRGVAMHCRGGLGRTGTMLAALLVWHGDTPEAAIHRVRAAQPHAIQNDVQLGFVHDFASRISAWH